MQLAFNQRSVFIFGPDSTLEYERPLEDALPPHPSFLAPRALDRGFSGSRASGLIGRLGKNIAMLCPKRPRDHDFRNRLLLDFYAPSLTRSHTLRHIPQTHWHRESS